MEDLDFKTEISGGFYKALLLGIGSALGWALGEDLEEVWKEGWNDPYGRD